MNLKFVPSKDLEAELHRRDKLKAMDSEKFLKEMSVYDGPEELDALKSLVTNALIEIIEHDKVRSDAKQYIFEDVCMLFYGKDIFTAIRILRE